MYRSVQLRGSHHIWLAVFWISILLKCVISCWTRGKKRRSNCWCSIPCSWHSIDFQERHQWRTSASGLSVFREWPPFSLRATPTKPQRCFRTRHQLSKRRGTLRALSGWRTTGSTAKRPLRTGTSTGLG